MHLIAPTAVSVLCLGLAAASPALAETLIFSSNVPPAHWANVEMIVPFQECVTERSNGEIEFNFFPGGQIANHTASLEALNKGLAQVGYVVVSALTDKLPLNNISMLPGMGGTVVEMTAASRKVIDSDGPFAQELRQNNIVPLIINMYPPYQVMSNGDAFTTLAALSGKKISVGGGAHTFTVQAFGGLPIEMGAGDIYMALQQGTVDGAMLSTASVPPYKLEEQITSLSANGTFGSASAIVSIDAGVWERLSDASKTAFRDCGLEGEEKIARWLDEETARLKADLAAQGVNVYDFTPRRWPRLMVPCRNRAKTMLRVWRHAAFPPKRLIRTIWRPWVGKTFGGRRIAAAPAQFGRTCRRPSEGNSAP